MRDYLEKAKQNWLACVLAVALILCAGYIVYDKNGNALQVATGNKYVGSVNSDKYHKPDCKWAQNIYTENEVWFSSKEDARSQGYKPCQTCNQ